MSVTTNTAIYLVIRKILQSRYYFRDEENKTGWLSVVPRSQLVSGRVRQITNFYPRNHFPARGHGLIGSQSWKRHWNSSSKLPTQLRKLYNIHVRKISENLFKYFEGLGAWDLESSRLRSWKSGMPTLISSLILHASSTKPLLLFNSLLLSP